MVSFLTHSVRGLQEEHRDGNCLVASCLDLVREIKIKDLGLLFKWVCAGQAACSVRFSIVSILLLVQSMVVVVFVDSGGEDWIDKNVSAPTLSTLHKKQSRVIPSPWNSCSWRKVVSGRWNYRRKDAGTEKWRSLEVLYRHSIFRWLHDCRSRLISLGRSILANFFWRWLWNWFVMAMNLSFMVLSATLSCVNFRGFICPWSWKLSNDKRCCLQNQSRIESAIGFSTP